MAAPTTTSNAFPKATNPLVILITGASSGFGLQAAQLCALDGHVVWAGYRNPRSPFPVECEKFSKENSCDLRAVSLDVTSDESCAAAISTVFAAPEGRLDVLVHNAGHMVFGPAESFMPSQYIACYEVNCLGCHRLNRAALPQMRAAGRGLMIWVSSSSVRGPCSPYLAPYFAAKAAMDSLAQTYSVELSKWGIETSIVVPGIFTRGTKHFEHSGHPEDQEVEKAYEEGPYKGVADRCLQGSNDMCPVDADPADVGRAIVKLVGMKRGSRPFRLHVEPAKDGAENVNALADTLREEYLERMNCGDLVHVDLQFGQ